MELVKTQTNNRIPDGYKSTELGVIPEDWEQIKLSEITTFIGSGSTSTKGKGDYPLMGSTGIIGTCNKPEYSGKAILVARVGANAGKINYVVGNYGVSDNTILIKIKKEIELNFVKELLLHKNLNSLVFGSGQPLITGSQLKGLVIPFPPTLKEQKAIAGALSDVDALICSLDQLISKKKAIKQGAMKELLTPPNSSAERSRNKGGKRLPGFDGDWVEKKLGEIAEVATGTTPPTSDLDNYGSEFCFVSPADLGKGKYITKTVKNLSAKGFAISRQFPKDSIMVTCIGSTIGKIGIAEISLTSNQQINAVFPNETFMSEYLYYQLSLMTKKIKLMASEQAVPMINKSEFSEIIVSLPEIEEQKAIAKILSDMDKDIEHLEAKKEKYKQIKQGMMQELLTGKIRLV